MANAMQRFKKSGVKRLPALQGGNGVGGNKEGRKYLGPRPQNKVKQVQATGAVTNATEGVLKQRQKEYREKNNNNNAGGIKIAKVKQGAREAVGRKAMNKGGLMNAVKKIVGKRLSEKQYLKD